MSNVFEPLIENWLPRILSPLYRYPVKPDWIEIVEVEIPLTNLPTAFDGFRLVHISDIHAGTWVTKERLQMVLDRVRNVPKDALAFTGDLVSYHYESWEDALIQAFQSLRKDSEVYAVLGNHDHWSDNNLIEKILTNGGVTLLNNDIAILDIKDQKLVIAGVDDLWEQKDDLTLVLNKIDSLGLTDTCVVLLAHEPDFALKAGPTGRFCLQISGHSHGGQFILPWIGPVARIPGSLRYYLGLKKAEDMWVYTNRGLGTSTVPLRINCRPEITVYTLKSTCEGK